MARDWGNVRAVWAQYIRTRSEKLRNELMEHYLPVVRHTAQRIHAKLPREVEIDDLISAGTFGLLDAIEAYDLARSVKFETYCSPRIRGAILDELRSWDWVPRLARLRSHKLVDALRELRMEIGREPTHEELALRLGVARDELERITRDGSLIRVMPLSRRRVDAGDEDGEGDMLEDKRYAERVRGLEREDLRELLTRGLSRAEQLIIILYYFEQMTMKEIGMTLDLSESRVSQMHSAVLARLHGQLEARQEELEEVAAA